MVNRDNNVFPRRLLLLGTLALAGALAFSGLTGCSGPARERLTASQNAVVTAWDSLKPLLVKRYEHLRPVITSYEESFGFKNGEYTGDPRVFGWSSYTGGDTINIYAAFPGLRISDNLKASLDGLNAPSLTTRVRTVKCIEQSLATFLSAAAGRSEVRREELQKVRADILGTQRRLMLEAANLNSSIDRYNEDLRDPSNRRYASRLGFFPIIDRLTVGNVVSFDGSGILPLHRLNSGLMASAHPGSGNRPTTDNAVPQANCPLDGELIETCSQYGSPSLPLHTELWLEAGVNATEPHGQIRAKSTVLLNMKGA